MEAPHQLIRRATQRMPVAAIAAAAALVVLGGWLWFTDHGALHAEPRIRLARATVDATIARLQMRQDQLEVDIAAQQQDVMTAEKSIRELQQLKSTWDWFGGNRAQQRATQVRLDLIEARHAREAGRLAELKQQLRRVQWEHESHVLERERLDEQLREEAEYRAGLWAMARRAWLWSRSWLLVGLALYLGAPVLWRGRSQRRDRGRPVIARPALRRL